MKDLLLRARAKGKAERAKRRPPSGPIVLWVLGLTSGYVHSGFIHILLVVAVVIVLIRISQGRNPISQEVI